MKKVWFVSLVLILAAVSYGRVEFEGVYAPSQGLVSPVEQSVRQELCLNGRWDFQGVEIPANWKRGEGMAPELTPADPNGWETVKIKIPSPWNVNGFVKSTEGADTVTYPSYPENWIHYEMGWMRKIATVPANWAGQKIVLHFEAVAGCTEVYVNGEKVIENFDLFLPFEADLTDKVRPGQEIEILVGVRKHNLFNKNTATGRRVIPAGSMWGQYIAGIWQDVSLLAMPKVRIHDVYVKPLVSKGVLELDVTLKNDSEKATSVSVEGLVQTWVNGSDLSSVEGPVYNWTLGEEVLSVAGMTVDVAAGEMTTVTLSVPVQDELDFWTPDSPNLYGLTLNLMGSKSGWFSKKPMVDTKYQRFGWREWTFEGMDVLLNGEKMELRGESGHFVGIPQMTRRFVWAWYKATQDANANTVRPHAQVYPRFYMDLADEMGICILSETANWASDGGPLYDSEFFWKTSDDHLKRLVLRDRNYPSIFGWSLTNENRPIIMNVFKRPDLMPVQEAAWTRWVKMIAELDPTRPWISGDGEEDGGGTLPTVIGHYGVGKINRGESGSIRWRTTRLRNRWLVLTAIGPMKISWVVRKGWRMRRTN